MNEVLRLMGAHRSVRAYRPTPVPEEHIAAAVRAAQMTSTSSWIQAYALLQVTDPGERARLRELCGDQAQVQQAGAFFAVCADTRRHRLIAEREGAPYESNLEVFILALVDTALFAQSLALAFESMGHGVCFIGGLRTGLPEADRLLELPQGVWPLFGMCVGEAAQDPGQRPRLPLEAVWMRDRYPDDGSMLGLVDAHDALAAEYHAARGAPGRDWSGGTWRKFKQPLRTHLFEYYRSKGAAFE